MRRLSILLAAAFLFLQSSAYAEDAGFELDLESIPIEEVFSEEPWAETFEQSADLQTSIAPNVKAAILVEAETGSVIFKINEHIKLAPASVTKIMTMLLISEAIADGSIKLDDMVTTSTAASRMGGSQIFLKENEQMTVSDLFKSIAVASANDASVALAEHISGSEGAFVAKMNSRAKELGMNDTNFANCTGLPGNADHLTSANDIAVMSRALIALPTVHEFSTIWTDTVRNGEFGLSNTNKLIRFYNGATGLKTGFTDAAKFCLSATAKRDGIEYIAVVLGAPTSDTRFEAAKTLLNHAFSTYTLADVCADTALAPIPVTLGKEKFVQPAVSGETKVLVEKSKLAGLKRSVTIAEAAAAPLEAGQELGTLTIADAEGNVIIKTPLVCADAVEKLGWWDLFKRYLELLFVGR
ncbi:MAG: D-alanyl-D-alanine carboxypeptidase [Oscillospiraceae bacterium]|jgi:D-alanyl-D-alanine carboxypeptidase (penicillin-binding protein 5/6)|nr:D-alanyl-D-alanine carboxypeptidase [Oscillospiraceae bacterium]